MDGSDAASMGPAMFIGLTVYVLATQGEPPPEPLNPSETMDMAAASVPVVLAGLDTGSRNFPITQTQVTSTGLEQVTNLAPPSATDLGFQPVSSIALALPLDPPPLFEVARPNAPRESRAFSAEARDEDPRLATVTAKALPFPVGERGLETSAPTQWVRVQGERVNFRTAPSLAAQVLTQLNTGDRVVLLADRGEWARVAVYGATDVQNGWVSTRYLVSD